MIMPDYHGGSIVNLMTSIVRSLGGENAPYQPLRALPAERLTSRNIVLLVIDGLGHEYLIAHRHDGVLAAHMTDRITSVFPTTTAAAITTFLTGTAPQQHGITGWFTYFRELGEVLAVLPYRTRRGGARPTVAACDLFDHEPVFDRLEAHSHVVAPSRIVHSEFNRAHQGKARPHAYENLGQMFKTVEQTLRSPGERKYVYAYWPELDRLAHEHGIASREAVAHLAEIDTAFGHFLDRIRGTGTTVIVTSDHGFVDSRAEQTLELDAHPQLAHTLSLPLSGERRTAYCYVHANQRSQFVEYVTRHLAEYVDLKTSEDLIQAGYFGLGLPHPRLHERIGDYILLMRDVAIIKDWLPGEPRYVQIGVHGGLSAQEMYVPLIVAET